MNKFSTLYYQYRDQPNEVALETMALCNAACTFCPYPSMERKGDKMPDELIDRVIRQLAEFTKPFFFSPFKVNEPLLDKRLIDICRRVEAETIARIRIFSNGAPLTQKKIDEIASLERVTHLWISLNSTDPVQYEELMSIPFERTAARLDNLHSQDFPHTVVLSKVGWPDEDFRRYCFKRWPKFESVTTKRCEWLGYTWPQDTTIPDTPCPRWWELSIMASGVVSLCCQDAEGHFPIGDIREQTLLEVYNSPEWRERRLKYRSRKGLPVCETCTYGG